MYQKSIINNQVRQKSCVLSLEFCCVLLFLIFSAGCASQQGKTSGGISEPITARAEIIRVTEDVLTGMHFPIEKADMQNGLIRTKPLPGAQFFELWRSDNIGVNNWAFANLHSIRRTAEIRITEQNEQMHIDCLVRIQRLSLPGREIDSTARAYEMFSESGPQLQTLQLGAGQIAGMAWVDLGRDQQLETEILQRIERQIAPHKIHNNSSAASEGI